MRAVQQPTTGHTQLAADSPGQQLGLIEPSIGESGSAGGRPGDDVEPRRIGLTQPEASDHEMGEMTGQTPTVAVLERQQRRARRPLERHRCDHR